MSHATARTVLDQVRAAAPLVGCITNSVVTNFTANVLLALGAAPAMVDIIGEAGPFAAAADGQLINVGTPGPEQRGASMDAAVAAGRAGTPWVLDPVAIGRLIQRTALAHQLVKRRPTAVRGNASEIIALAGLGPGGRGVESSDEVESALGAARSIAERFGSVVAVSGPTDAIVSADRVARVGGGSAMLTLVTGGGCALGAVIAAFLAAGRAAGVDAFDSVVACHAVYSAAAEIAAENSSGPGSFQPAFLDALHGLSGADLDRIALS
ncbi:hydroxyethylthiazole kinase [uncultured Propionibacterium sp.]|uniref:hydroxyethylthiazole kinase n=1 Tax=uncultured Propionibacterium sp. TaxID=218066 RepID=UPI00292FC9E2|nr:hydroxyethylthiazole kinase [uncultured Propionibacterium sp.]